jgi:hypothetical protein
MVFREEQLLVETVAEDTEPQVSEINEDLITSQTSQNDWEIVEEMSRREESEVDGTQLHLDIQVSL